MKLSKRRILACFLAVMLCMAAFSIPAYAEGGDYQEYEIPPEENTNPEVLTPEGNMTLVDDITGEAANEKEFITVVTKNGHYFYIVIDRSDSGNNTVHFLNWRNRSRLHPRNRRRSRRLFRPKSQVRSRIPVPSVER